MTSANPYVTSGDTGSGDRGVNLDPHVTGNPFGSGGASITVGHTWIIIVGAMVLLWLLGFAFRKFRI